MTLLLPWITLNHSRRAVSPRGTLTTWEAGERMGFCSMLCYATRTGYALDGVVKRGLAPRAELEGSACGTCLAPITTLT